MSDRVLQAARLMEMLPEEDQDFAVAFLKKLVQAWDPDYTKVTPQEAREIAEAEASGFIAEADIDWNNLSRYAE